ncbi:serine/threonine-protein kinase [Mycolicibacterium boenickei]
MEFKPGDEVGGYTIEGVLGRGGMGIVYRAANPTLPRSDAVKVLSAEYSNDPQFRARFEREATVAATLSHPNIVAVYARGKADNGQLWIAMQYVAGTDADHELREGKMTPERAAHVTAEVAKALDYAHRRGVLHRDVKPANFLITPAEHDGDDERVFLADFGIARAKDDTTHLTTDGTVMASIAYASPEALSGTTVDHRADIYSLGCSLYRMLTGKTPFAGRGGVEAILTAHLTAPPPRVTDLAPNLPAGLNDVIAKAMAKDPAARYQSARELANATTEALADNTTAVPRSTVTQEWGATPPPPPMPDAPTRPAGRPPAWNPNNPRSQYEPAITYPSGVYSGPHANAGNRSREFTAAPQAHQAVAPVPVQKKSLKRRLVIPAAAVAIVAVLAVGFVMLYLNNPNNAPYQPQTVTHAHGTTEITASPRAVAALGPGDADALLSLGMQPVAVQWSLGELPSWIRDKITGDPPVMNFIDTGAVKAAKPDLILATGDIDASTYDSLKAIAPTITRPTDEDRPWNWQNQLQWVAKIVGKEGAATQLTSKVATQQNDLRNQNSGVAGKTVGVLNLTDEGVSETLAPSNASDYFSSLGLTYSPKFAREPGEEGKVTRPVGNLSLLYRLDTDVLVVVRTDKGAGGGGAAGLPVELNAFRGAMVIVDDPDTVAALAEPGGVLATQFLNTSLVPKLVDQIP